MQAKPHRGPEGRPEKEEREKEGTAGEGERKGRELSEREERERKMAGEIGERDGNDR